MQSECRIAYWDNAKLCLMFLVVLGHFLQFNYWSCDVAYALYYWLYSFHIPAFVFISGVFSKNYIKNRNRPKKLFGYFILYIAFSLMLDLIDCAFTNSPPKFSIFIQSSTPWYMLAMLVWYLLLPFLSRLRPAVSMPVFILIGIAAGAFDFIGAALSLSRMIVFLPFFLLGYHTDTALHASIKPWMRRAAAAFLCLAFIHLLYNSDQIKKYLALVYALNPYSELSLSTASGMLARAVWYICSFAMTAAFLIVIPVKNTGISFIGQRTLGIYIVHRLIRALFDRSGFFLSIGDGSAAFFCCAAAAVSVFFFSSIKQFNVLAAKAFNSGITERIFKRARF